MKNLYLERKKVIEKELNEFPIVYAFSEEQLTKGLEKLGATREEVISIGAGGIVKETDLQRFRDMLDGWNKSQEEGLKNPDYVYQMFMYEMPNHEYGYTMDLEDTLEACGLTIEEINKNPILKKGLERAQKDYLKADIHNC